jgi:arabinofuranosyltransferase
LTAAAYAWTGAPGVRRVAATAALLGLAAWTRPEGLGVAGLFLVAGIVARARGRGADAPPAGDDLRLAALVLAPVGALVAWRLATFGDVVPNTFHAKTGMSPYIPLRGLLYAAYFAAFYLVPWVPAWRVRPRDTPPPPAAGRFARTVLLTLVAGWTLYVIVVGGDYMAMHRFFVPVLPAFDLLIGAMVARALAAPGKRSMVLGTAAFGLAFTLVHSTPLDVLLFGHPRAQQGNYEGVVNERRAVERFAAVGRWFGAHRRAPDEVLATKVIGAMGWFADVRVLDMFGLTDRHIARAGRSEKPLGLGFPGHERTDLGYVAARRPTWIFLELAERPRRVSHPDWNPAANDLLNEEYVVRGERLEVPGQGAAWLYFLERKDRVPRAP